MTRFGRALVVGLGASGLAAARLLLARGVSVVGYDRRERVDDLPEGLQPALGAETAPAWAWANIDLLVLSPGVAPEPWLAARATYAPRAAVHGELSLGLALLDDDRRPRPRRVLVTGTNGKSTVTALTGALLSAAGRRTFVGGNLGTPVCTLVLDLDAGRESWPDDLVIECSSFQLETLPPHPTDVGIVLNVTPDHLDRYATLEDYARTKAKVFDGIGPRGLAILDAEDPWCPRIAPTHCPVAWVGRDAVLDGEGADARLVLPGGAALPRALLRLAGRHNARNALFALMAADHLGVPPQARQRALESFEGLPHRMRHVRDLDGVAWYNDSKATNVASALASLGGLDRPFVLIAGGRLKGDDLSPLGELLARRGRGLVAIGESAAQVAALARPPLPVRTASDMAEAVAQARTMARPGDAVVLAPACASYDWFRSYAHRGEVFEAAVDALARSG